MEVVGRRHMEGLAVGIEVGYGRGMMLGAGGRMDGGMDEVAGRNVAGRNVGGYFGLLGGCDDG